MDLELKHIVTLGQKLLILQLLLVKTRGEIASTRASTRASSTALEPFPE